MKRVIRVLVVVFCMTQLAMGNALAGMSGNDDNTFFGNKGSGGGIGDGGGSGDDTGAKNVVEEVVGAVPEESEQLPDAEALNRAASAVPMDVPAIPREDARAGAQVAYAQNGNGIISAEEALGPKLKHSTTIDVGEGAVNVKALEPEKTV